MKPISKVIILLILISCGDRISSNNSEIYRSTNESSQEDFYIEIKNQEVTLYGWEIDNEQHTIYYRSVCEVDQDSLGIITIQPKTCDLSDIKHDLEKLSSFKSKSNLKLNILGTHIRFWGTKDDDGSFDFLAVKNFYLGRADKFKFEKIK